MVRRQEIMREQSEAVQANELMHLRSASIKAVMARNAFEEARMQLPEYMRPAPAPLPPPNPRVAQLEKSLQVYETLTPVSPMQIDTTPQAGHNTQGRAPGMLVPMEPAPAPAPPSQRGPSPRTTMRGGTWPIGMEYFRGPTGKTRGARKEVKV